MQKILTADEVIEKVERLLNRRRSARVIYSNGGTYTFSADVAEDSSWVRKLVHDNFGVIEAFAVLDVREGLELYEPVQFGSDPELFFVKDKKVVPSYLAVPLTNDNGVVQDGFQVELHPEASHCRELAANRVYDVLSGADYLAGLIGARISFKPTHIIDGETFKKAPRDTKQFGCNPTSTVYEEKLKRPTGLRTRMRSAGGHLHIGFSESLFKKRDVIVRVMDILVGNTCVLLDRDPANAIRRKYYGRAGEYREKPYGLEYRVPSNFWLQSYTLFSILTGLMRQSVAIVRKGKEGDLLCRFNESDVRKAINNNDTALALNNFAILAKFYEDNQVYGNAGLGIHNIHKFKAWVETEKPLAYIKNLSVPSKPLRGWARDQERAGMERFLNNLEL